MNERLRQSIQRCPPGVSYRGAPVSWTGAVRPESLLAAQQAPAPAARAATDSTSEDTAEQPPAEPTLAPAIQLANQGALQPDRPQATDPDRSPHTVTDNRRRKPLPWHELLRRVFSVDVMICPICSGPLTVIAYLTDPNVVGKILAHLSLPTASAPPAPARDPSQQLDLAFDDQLVDSDFVPPASHRSRAPPSSHEPHDWTIELDHDWGA